MKQYVKDIASEILLRGTISVKQRESIMAIVRLNEKGVLRDLDSVREMLKVVDR